MNGENYNQAANSYAIALANKGFTLRPRDLTTPTKGYVVGFSDQPKPIPVNEFTLEKYVESFNKVAKWIVDSGYGSSIPQLESDALIAANTDMCVGGWEHEGKWYIESTQVVADIRDAMYLAKSNNQKAIYDLAEKKEIFVKDYFDTKTQS